MQLFSRGLQIEYFFVNTFNHGSLNRTLRFSAVAVIPGLDILGNPETKYCVCDVRNTAPPNQKYCPP